MRLRAGRAGWRRFWTRFERMGFFVVMVMVIADLVIVIELVRIRERVVSCILVSPLRLVRHRPRANLVPAMRFNAAVVKLKLIVTCPRFVLSRRHARSHL